MNEFSTLAKGKVNLEIQFLYYCKKTENEKKIQDIIDLYQKIKHLK